MEEQSKLAERILDHVADAVISTDRSGAIIRWNHASSALFGYSAEEALTRRSWCGRNQCRASRSSPEYGICPALSDRLEASQCIERFSGCRAYCSNRPHDRFSREVCRKTCRDELTQCKRTRGA